MDLFGGSAPLGVTSSGDRMYRCYNYCDSQQYAPRMLCKLLRNGSLTVDCRRSQL
jgi:hypothetical protein